MCCSCRRAFIYKQVPKKKKSENSNSLHFSSSFFPPWSSLAFPLFHLLLRVRLAATAWRPCALAFLFFICLLLSPSVVSLSLRSSMSLALVRSPSTQSLSMWALPMLSLPIHRYLSLLFFPLGRQLRSVYGSGYTGNRHRNDPTLYGVSIGTSFLPVEHTT